MRLTRTVRNTRKGKTECETGEEDGNAVLCKRRISELPEKEYQNEECPLERGGDDPQQKKPPLPQQQRRRMIQIQSQPQPFPKLKQLLCSHPHPLFPPPQQHRIRISQMILHPLPPVLQLQLQLQSQPQFVAAKSLIPVPPKIIYNSSYEGLHVIVSVFLKDSGKIC